MTKPDAKYSFCESVWATRYSRWHIRRLTDMGPHYARRIDTASLCGRVKKREGWDRGTRITKAQLSGKGVCQDCKKRYLAAIAVKP